MEPSPLDSFLSLIINRSDIFNPRHYYYNVTPKTFFANSFFHLIHSEPSVCSIKDETVNDYIKSLEIYRELQTIASCSHHLLTNKNISLNALNTISFFQWLFTPDHEGITPFSILETVQTSDMFTEAYKLFKNDRDRSLESIQSRPFSEWCDQLSCLEPYRDEPKIIQLILDIGNVCRTKTIDDICLFFNQLDELMAVYKDRNNPKKLRLWTKLGQESFDSIGSESIQHCIYMIQEGLDAQKWSKKFKKMVARVFSSRTKRQYRELPATE